eukprot:542766-Pyramimonas_sp.AAC.1
MSNTNSRRCSLWLQLAESPVYAITKTTQIYTPLWNSLSSTPIRPRHLSPWSTRNATAVLPTSSTASARHPDPA